ncbi:Vacuolar cation/proton exchanger 2 [Zostera marina]|uniref:Vacuolar cation/proton exchanger n=1 Tax=Zostera marina TaxID=29655 RepID=A0A0K9NMM7_ZOSMR|nr:Vacuolar cation/proton exchanger 2 [Zostera marina]
MTEIPQFGVRKDIDIDLEKENLVSSSSNVNRKIAFQTSQVSSLVNSSSSSSSTNQFFNRLLINIQVVIFGTKINTLLPFGPLAIVLHYFSNRNGLVFLFSLIGIAPLAERLGYATEQLAFYTGPTVGGLLNATFGNATEMIISICALNNGMIRVVQQSLLGSILSNMLLVLGCAFFSGGIVHKNQVFNKAASVANLGLLLMAVMGLTFPAVLYYTHSEIHFGKSELSLSRFSSCVMLVAYVSHLFFTLKSHKDLHNPDNIESTILHKESGDADKETSNEDEEVLITRWESIIWLGVLTIFISALSGLIVNTIEEASVSTNIPVSFISVVLLPIVGNAAEHASAIMFAVKNKLDITLGVAIGSSTQISMFLIPLSVVVGWIIGKPMDLNFQLFETVTLFITVLIVAFMLQEGTSNYFKGLVLIMCYLIVSASFFVHVDPTGNH